MLSSIFVDGEFYAKINNEIAYKYKLHQGKEVNEELLLEIAYESDYKRAKDKALYALSFRDYAKGELIEKLKIDYSDEAANAAADKMEELGFLNDTRFAQRYAKELIFTKKLSKSRAEYELIKKRISKDIIECVMSDIEYEPIDQIKFLIEKKYKGAYDDEKIKRRAISYLQRQGYSFSDIKNVLLNTDSY